MLKRIKLKDTIDKIAIAHVKYYMQWRCTSITEIEICSEDKKKIQ